MPNRRFEPGLRGMVPRNSSEEWSEKWSGQCPERFQDGAKPNRYPALSPGVAGRTAQEPEVPFRLFPTKALTFRTTGPRNSRLTADSYFHYNHGSTCWASGRTIRVGGVLRANPVRGRTAKS